MNARVDLETALSTVRLGRTQIAVILLCGLIALVDGFDTQTIGMVAPSMAIEWHVSPALFGPIFGAGLFAGMIGAFTFGRAGDRWGRKPVLVTAILIFALGSLATPATHTIGALVINRLITGVGLGGALPIVIAITSEFAPLRLRTRVVAIMFCGFPLGSVIGSLLTAELIPVFGWRSVFYVGGIVPLIALPFFLWLVPESARFLAVRQQPAKVAAVLSRMGCEVEWNGVLPVGGARERGSIAALFRQGRAGNTILIWITLFLSLLLTVFLVSWLPLLTHQAGLSLRSAVLAVACLNLGGILGGFLIGRLCDGFQSAAPIAISYALGGIAVCAMGFVATSTPLLLGAAFVAGLLTVGAQMSAIALSASLYDTAVRSTGVGCAFGMGRIGAVVGPVVGGILIGMQVEIGTLFLLAGMVALGAGVAVAAMGPAWRQRAE